MRVVITGGAGFIGSHIAERLLQRGDVVVVIDNLATGSRSNLPTDSRLTFVEGNIANAELVNRLFGDVKPDRVIHAAASYRDPDNWFKDANTNVLGSINVARACQRFHVGRLLYFQTALCYGLHPIEQPITLNHPLNPQASSYALSKTAGEHYIRLSDVNHITLRLANVYGPRNLGGPVPTFYHRLSKGEPCFVMDTRRDFIFVADVVDVAVQALDIENASGSGVYHVSTGCDISIKELFDTVVEALGIELNAPVEVRPRSPDDAFSILLDPSKTIENFDWAAKTALGDGIKAAIDWYRSHGVTETYTHLSMEAANR